MVLIGPKPPGYLDWTNLFGNNIPSWLGGGGGTASPAAAAASGGPVIGPGGLPIGSTSFGAAPTPGLTSAGSPKPIAPPPPTQTNTATGGARPGSELLRPAADLGALNGPQPPAPVEPYQYGDFDAIMAQIAAGLGGGSSGSSSSALDSIKLSQPGSILSDLMKQLGAAPNLPTMDIQGMAQNAIKSKYDPQFQALADQLASLGINYQQGVTREQGYGTKADTALQGIYDALSKGMQEGNQRTLGYYDQASGASGSAYDQAMAALQGLNEQVRGTLGGQAAGIGANTSTSPTGPLARIMASFMSQQGANIGNKANTLGNLATTRANAGQFGESQLARAQNTGAQTRADVQAQVANALSQMNLQNIQGQGEIGRQKAALQKQQPLDLAQIVSQLTQQQYEQQRQAQQDRLAQITGLGGLDINQQKNTIASQGNQVALAKAQSQASNTKTTNDLARQALLLKNVPAPPKTPAGQQQAQVVANTNLANTRANVAQNPPVTNANIGIIGPKKLNEFLTTPQKGLWSDKAGPNFSKAVSDLTDMASRVKLSGKDPYMEAQKLIYNDPLFTTGKWKNQSKTGLIAAAQALFTGSYTL